VALLGKSAVIRVIGNRAFCGSSQISRVAKMIGMNVCVKDESKIMYFDAYSSATGFDPLGIPSRSRVDENGTMIPDQQIRV